VRVSLRTLASGLFSTRSVICAYVGSGFHLMVPAAFWAWMPSFLNRYYGMAPGKAAVMAAGFVLVTGAGMVVCGMLTDRLNRHSPAGKWTTAIVFCLLTFVLLEGAFVVAQGPLQLTLIATGLFFSAGATGPSGAMVANLTPDRIHSSAFATLTLANNVLGLAPAAVLAGAIADHAGLAHALQIIPFVLLLAVLAFSIGRRGYPRDLARLDALRESSQTDRH
jgi:MFS family permease